MRSSSSFRPLFLVVVLVGGFYFLTTHRHAPWEIAGMSRLPDQVEITEAAEPPSFDNEEQNNIALYKRVLPAVVNITSTAVAFDFFYGAVPQEGIGSGFIIDRGGHILTNFHVIADARRVEVTLANRKKYRAEIVGTDPSHDLAVILIHAPDLTPATLGDSKKLAVGQKVLAIGNPFGLSGTMTRGIVSSMRSIRAPDGTPIDDAIQTDASINPGNSGGPLLNSRGEVIGINTQIATLGANQSAGVGFAVPINTAKAVLNDLVTGGRVRRPSLGIRGLPIGPELAQQLGLPADYGVLIQQIVRGGAAEAAGLRAGTERGYIGNTPVMLGGDVIIAINGQDISDTRDLAGAMNNHRAGDKITVTIYRGKKKMDVPVTLGEARQTA